jgi:putative pyoverdin transport system ATP-binding/permease protein
VETVWLLYRRNSHKTFVILLLGLISGAASTALIATANNALYSSSGAARLRWLLPLAFAAAVALKVGSSLLSSLMLGRSMQDITVSMCEGICKKVAATPLAKLEEIGGHRVMACLTDDIEVLAASIQVIPNLMVDLAMLGGCAIYLAWISWDAALALAVLIILVTFGYRMLLVKAQAAIIQARNTRDTLFHHFRSLVEGIKEIKLNNDRKEAFFREDIDRTAQDIRDQHMVAIHRYAFVDGWCQSMFYILLGAVLFGFPALHTASLKTLTAYVFVALYMMGPILGIVASVPYFSRGKAAIEKLNQIGMALADANNNVPTVSDSPAAKRLIKLASLPNAPLIELRDVTFRHGNEKEAFDLGPINLTLYPGELVFIIGGNGSGKSTLAKLLTGLYPPDSGEICVDGIPVTPDAMGAYCELYSAVFSDFYLFNRLVGLDKSVDWSERAQEYLTALELSETVKLNGTSFSTTSLSQGQRRRLALLVAYMEDRPIYVLDEWAAEQDPVFRQTFYLKLLPELKRRGKTVVLITHDDRFFHLGDRVIKLNYGKVVETLEQGVPTGSLQA